MGADNPWVAQLRLGGGQDLCRRVLEELHPGGLSDAAFAELLLYLEQTIVWGQRMDLVAPRTLEEFVDLSLADAAVLAQAELTLGAAEDRLVDVGTGGGAPGIPLSILLHHGRGGAAMTLVEPRSKRVTFLRSVVGQLAGPVRPVVRSRSDVLGERSFDVALARATLPPVEWLSEGARLARRAVWLLLAKDEAPSSPSATVMWQREYVWPLTGVKRTALRYAVATPES